MFKKAAGKSDDDSLITFNNFINLAGAATNLAAPAILLLALILILSLIF